MYGISPRLACVPFTILPAADVLVISSTVAKLPYMTETILHDNTSFCEQIAEADEKHTVHYHNLLIVIQVSLLL